MTAWETTHGNNRPGERPETQSTKSRLS